MKRFSICALTLVVFVAASSVALATSVPVSSESSQSILTVVFDSAPEFDSTKGSVQAKAAPATRMSQKLIGTLSTADAPETEVKNEDLPTTQVPMVSPDLPAGPSMVVAPSNPDAVPEPSTLILLGLGVLGLVGLVRRKKA